MIKIHNAERPTMYFIGVTTAQSSIMRVFPEWVKVLGIDAVMVGVDLPLHAPEEEYRQVVEYIKKDPLSMGALVTTHKLDLFNSCRDLFEYVDPYAAKLEEVSSLSKDISGLCAHAKDPITSGCALKKFIPRNYWVDNNGEVLIMGAGGSALAMSMYLSNLQHGKDVPRKITVTNRSLPRLAQAKYKLNGLNPNIEFNFEHCPNQEDNDALIKQLPPYSLIVNATGLGKDAPGSPTSYAVDLPSDSMVWEINYRGNLIFYEQAKAQRMAKRLHVEDGWQYFIYGWTSVISEVFHVEINEEMIEELSAIAKRPGEAAVK